MAITKAGVELELNKTHNGIPVIPNPKCKFRYNLDFSKNVGSAFLNAINSEPVNIALYPIGTEGMWDFISAIQPTRFVVNEQLVMIYRVALNIDPFTGEESAAILFNRSGTCVLSTRNFDIYCDALSA